MSQDDASAPVSEPTGPPGRQVVVLRPGPPKRRGVIVDGIVGVLGVALLVYAGVLGATLPEEEVVPVQYLPEFNTTAQTVPIDLDGQLYPQSIVFRECPPDDATCPGPTLEQTEYELEFEVTHDNVFSVRIAALTPGDDIPGSDPDTWQFALRDHNGEEPPNSLPKRLTTKPSIVKDVDPEDPDPTTLAQMQRSEINEAWRFAAPPDPEFITGGPNLTREEALLTASQAYTIPTKGTWKVTMKAQNAGDCPSSPGNNPDAIRLHAACMRATDGSGQDPGNPITIQSISYDYYIISIPEE